MKIGIMSDSHDNLPAIEKAVNLFNREGVECLFHCGDFVAPFALLPLNKLECGTVNAVFGNNDGEVTGLSKVAKDHGWDVRKGPARFTAGDKRVTMMHEPDGLEEAVRQGGSDLILYGHLHKKEVREENGALIINPGEAGGWLTGEATVVTLDTADLKPVFHRL